MFASPYVSNENPDGAVDGEARGGRFFLLIYVPADRPTTLHACMLRTPFPKNHVFFSFSLALGFGMGAAFHAFSSEENTLFPPAFGAPSSSGHVSHGAAVQGKPCPGQLREQGEELPREPVLVPERWVRRCSEHLTLSRNKLLE